MSHIKLWFSGLPIFQNIDSLSAGLNQCGIPVGYPPQLVDYPQSSHIIQDVVPTAISDTTD